RNVGKSMEDMAWETSLQSIESFLRNNPDIAALTNADDFILTADNYRFIAETFGERAFLYPHGGHGGNLQYLAVMKQILAFTEGDYPRSASCSRAGRSRVCCWRVPLPWRWIRSPHAGPRWRS